MVNRLDLDRFWDPGNRGSHAVVIAGVIGQQMMIKDTHYGCSVTVGNIYSLVYDGHKVDGQTLSPRTSLVRIISHSANVFQS